MRKIILAIAFISCACSLAVFSQTQAITKAEFYSPVNSAVEKRFNSTRRETMKLEIYSKGNVESVKEEIEEFIPLDKKRYVLSTRQNGVNSRLELIKIGESYYQKIDDKSWTKEKRWNKGISFLSIPVPVSSSYTVEKNSIHDQPAQLYRFYAIYNESNAKEGEEKQTYWEQKTWIDKNGLDVREEIIVGKPQSKEILSRRIYEYDYSPDIKIESPIIKAKTKRKSK